MTNILRKKVIPIVYAVDDNYAPFLSVSLKSIMDNVSKEYFVKVYILNTGLSKCNEKLIVEIAENNTSDIDIEYVDVVRRMEKIADKTHLRDYYTNAIYYRIFIPSLFPQYEKIIYVDCDIVALDDISKLFNLDLGTNVVAAVHEEAMTTFECFGEYSEDFLGVPRQRYFNSGLLVINTKQYLKENIEDKFIQMMTTYKFEVAPDQDYLNVLLKDRVTYFDIGWNKTPLPNKDFPDEEVKLVHYKLNFKPWHYVGIRYEEYFWKYARKTPFYEHLIKMRDSYSEAEKQKDGIAFASLQKMAKGYVDSENNYKKLTNKKG